MGIILSKLTKSDSKHLKVSAAVQTETPRQTKEILDVRSPTAGIIRLQQNNKTPITVDKVNLEKDFLDEYQSYPLEHKLVKSLKLDPRSPTIGIYRTPILIEETPSDRTNSDKCNSPISIYSCNVNDSIVEDIMTPIESSMNVSGFEIPKEIIFGEADVTIGKEEIAENEENKSYLKVSDKPNTDEAKRLLEEIISDEENFLKVKFPKKRSKALKSTEKNSLGAKSKLRAPLSNITSSTNSPNNINVGVKLNSKNKVYPEFGSENSVTPNPKCMIQWDQNNTVII